jgi:hypothetical protein
MAIPIPRNYTRLALSIVIAAVVIGGAIVASSYLGTSRTATETTTSTLIRTSISTQTVTSQLYQVEFLQESNCPVGPGWLFPWGVMLDNQTLTQPSNATLPLSSNPLHFTGDSNYSMIWFSLPNGTYSYKIIPDDSLGSAQSGNITVDGSNVVVQVYAFIMAMGCSTSASSAGG